MNLDCSLYPQIYYLKELALMIGHQSLNVTFHDPIFVTFQVHSKFQALCEEEKNFEVSRVGG